MNITFPTPHPNISLLIRKIKIESHQQVNHLNDIRHDGVQVGEDREVTINKIPDFYLDFRI